MTFTWRAFFPAIGWIEAKVEQLETLPRGKPVEGPAIIESPFTTVVIDPGASARGSHSGGLVVSL